MQGKRQSQDRSPTERLEELNDHFDDMFAAEIQDWVSKLPHRQGGELADKNHPDPSNGLVGIAMSGGGMRSATYNFGVVQALARYGLMEQVDYMSTVSGGGYLGSSLTSLCSEELPYSDPQNPGSSGPTRLDMTRDKFPYAFPRPLGPYRDENTQGNKYAVPAHDLESPATRHLRQNSKLLAPALGLFQPEMWSAFGRYIAATALLWVLFLLPLVTVVSLASILIPEGIWSRSDPLGINGADSLLAANYWIFSIPLWFLGAVAFLALLPGGYSHQGEHFPPKWVRFLQRLFLIGAAATGGAVVFVFALWGVIFAFDNLIGVNIFKNETTEKLVQWVLGMLGVGGAAAAGVGGRKVMIPGKATRLGWHLLFVLGGYIFLGIGLILWYYFLVLFLAPGQLDHLDAEHRIKLDFYRLAWAGVGFILVFTWIAGPWLLNHLSMHKLYERRLRRSWIMGVKPPPDSPAPAADSQPRSEWSRVWIRPDIDMAYLAKQTSDLGATSPYPLICTALNIPGSTGPKLLDRKAASFVISPVYSGSALTHWRPTSEMTGFKRMPLSKAATIFNARLGWWLPNPRQDSSVLHQKMPPWILYWKEMFGIASHRDPFIYLSDGGHFENLGLYELLRRRCKYIIAVDATGESPEEHSDLNFSGLGLSLRLARVDFGVEVDIKLDPLLRDPQTGLVKSHFAVGQIRYPTQTGHGNPNKGDDNVRYLVLIKAGRVEKDWSPDLISYHRQGGADFPHHSTGDQQFDQPQFESYRQLGYLAGRDVCLTAKGDLDATPSAKFRLDPCLIGCTRATRKRANKYSGGALTRAGDIRDWRPNKVIGTKIIAEVTGASGCSVDWTVLEPGNQIDSSRPQYRQLKQFMVADVYRRGFTGAAVATISAWLQAGYVTRPGRRWPTQCGAQTCSLGPKINLAGP